MARSKSGGNGFLAILAVLGFLHAQPAVTCTLYCLLKGHPPGVAGHMDHHAPRSCHGGTVGANDTPVTAGVSQAVLPSPTNHFETPRETALSDPDVHFSTAPPHRAFDPPPPRD